MRMIAGHVRFKNSLRAVCLLLASLAVSSGVASAQGTIAGTVKDTSGAVLPGVTVEASSPALIEKSKTGISDDRGQYRIVDLRPGLYTVTFTLAGFRSVVREGISLTGDFAATVNADLAVGAVEEQVTVTGASPIVDVRNTQRRETIARDLLDAVPTGRNFQAVTNMLPAVVASKVDVGGSSLAQNGTVQSYGGSGPMVVELDGQNTAPSNLAPLYYSDGQVQEYVVTLAGGAADTSTGGIRINQIPKEGGNQFKGTFFGQFSGARLNASTLPEKVRAQGLTVPEQLKFLMHMEPSFGGPIVRDKLWFFVTGRLFEFNQYVFGITHKDGSRVIDGNRLSSVTPRLTYQINAKTKVTGAFDKNNKLRTARDIEMGGILSEAALVQHHPQNYLTSAKVTSTLTNNLLAEAGFSWIRYNHVSTYEPEVHVAAQPSFDIGRPLLIYGTGPAPTDPNGFGDLAHFDLITGIRSVANSTFGPTDQMYPKKSVVASLSYVSGAHQIKGGVQVNIGGFDAVEFWTGDIWQQYRNGVPDSVVTWNTPIHDVARFRDVGLYLQDSWTMGRLTLNPGIRWNWTYGETPATSAPAGRWVPERHFDAKTDLPNFKTWTPRFGAAYDVFGNGKTAVRGSVGSYVEQIGYLWARDRYDPMFKDRNVRTWTDTNRNDIAEANELGPSQNLTFGTRPPRAMDPAIKQPFNLLYTLGLQQELAAGLGFSVSYNRREYRNLQWTNNLSVAPTEYTLITIPDPRGTGTLPVYSLASNRLGQVNNLDVTTDSNTQIYNGVDLTFTYRSGNGATLFGGTSSGRVLLNTCQVEDPNSLRFCDQGQSDVPFRTIYKLSGTYPLIYGIRVSGLLQSVPGPEFVTNYLVNRTIVPTLTQSQVTVRLTEPGSQYLDRLNQLDIAVTKSFKVGTISVKPQVELFNAFNAQPVLTQNGTFGTSLGRPLTIQPGRLLRFGAQLEF